ncbi:MULTISPECIES: orotidine-5'-phosphate decarboxylase [unclassified Gilliamella]|uniref:orotidine-5'-phosphate decarboxylase n=1 Tax=unclassified Gilliamella TaxID=2685620 RepID=UPI002269E58E|nr:MULTISPECIES: orotidine-5'-phosphate decarboxylase [unclassified Gilliamella]MCX8573862.1 orotidine-5'-phosphate decarboxylase [Gilliamella sp. B3831]MCX8576093.1 orotidine-5'-phosphate decarboxylase [Gilliamella sp. B3815]MCX8603194.1 orotidine-5'-phosphate decarboxylase [Gilliamella sp. B3823]MCX8606569.1 orotidine-5'-phosphate decarboxylase [Gilliamella sp. B3825]MCX8636707.1 orotidine-5'-phosphate decarboxylase [Gilliamella sp. B3817]
MSSPIIVAVDFADVKSAWNFIDRVEPNDCRLKIGKELFTHAGPDFIKQIMNKGFDVFLDLKFHDIPNTVAKAIVAAADLGVWMTNVHASGGSRMMQAAKDALYPYGKDAPLLIAVTVLTSMESVDLQEIGIPVSPLEQATKLALLAKNCGLDGVVCSAKEVQSFRTRLGSDFKLVTPGIRPAGSNADDQRRIMTPQRAQAAGSDYLVIGRPITQAEDPSLALQTILSTLDLSKS